MYGQTKESSVGRGSERGRRSGYAIFWMLRAQNGGSKKAENRMREEGALLPFCSVMNKMKEELRYRESEVNGKIFGDMGSGSQTPVHGGADFRKQGIARLYPFDFMKKIDISRSRLVYLQNKKNYYGTLLGG